MTEIAFTPETLRALSAISTGIEQFHDAVIDAEPLSDLTFKVGISTISFWGAGVCQVTVEDDDEEPTEPTPLQAAILAANGIPVENLGGLAG